jgi:hypothetical protein
MTMSERSGKMVLRIAALSLLTGGTVRIIATRPFFRAFGMQELWPSHTYSLYIYKVLGAFVVLVGILLWFLSRDPVRYRGIVGGFVMAFFFVGSVMTLSGCYLKLSLVHFLIDPVFCFLVASLVWWTGLRR